MQVYSSLIVILNAAIEKEQKIFNAQKPQEMYEPMAYILGLGGKRVRPLLTLIACDLFNGNIEHALSPALSVELFHNFSLIHDDILDNAPLRRGEITVHEKWNQNIAILSGDGMLVKAFELLGKTEKAHIPAMLALFSKTGMEVCEGQQLDMNFENRNNVTVDEYIHMITYKTAVLLGCSLQMGALSAHASEKDQLHCYNFGKHVGIAFQLLDDVLDVYAEDEKFGKQIGGDIISNKKTYLLLKAIELCNAEQLNKLKRLLTDQNIPNEQKVRDVKGIYDALNVKQLAFDQANYHTDLALKHLQDIDADAAKKEQLKKFALFLLHRDK